MIRKLLASVYAPLLLADAASNSMSVSSYVSLCGDDDVVFVEVTNVQKDDRPEPLFLREASKECTAGYSVLSKSRDTVPGRGQTASWVIRCKPTSSEQPHRRITC